MEQSYVCMCMCDLIAFMCRQVSRLHNRSETCLFHDLYDSIWVGQVCAAPYLCRDRTFQGAQ